MLHQREQLFRICAEPSNALILCSHFSYRLVTLYFANHAEMLHIFICGAFFSSAYIVCFIHLPPFLYRSFLLCMFIYPLLEQMAHNLLWLIPQSPTWQPLFGFCAYLSGSCAIGLVLVELLVVYIRTELVCSVCKISPNHRRLRKGVVEKEVSWASWKIYSRLFLVQIRNASMTSPLVPWYFQILSHLETRMAKILANENEAHKGKNRCDISAPQEMMAAECVWKDDLTVKKHSL